MNAIDQLLSYDPLAAAEKQTGNSYKEDDATEMLGLGLAIRHNQLKAAALEEIGDTHHQMTLDYFFKLLDKNGFVKLLEEDIAGTFNQYYVYWHADGLLLDFDTFSWSDESKKKLNSGHIRFNWESSGDNFYPRHFTGGMWQPGCDQTPKRYVAVGYFDIREGLMHNINALRNEGKLLPVWVDDGKLRLMSYMDWKHPSFETWTVEAMELQNSFMKETTANRVKQFPQHVQDAIKGI